MTRGVQKYVAETVDARYGVCQYTSPMPTARKALNFLQRHRCPIMSRGAQVRVRTVWVKS